MKTISLITTLIASLVIVGNLSAAPTGDFSNKTNLMSKPSVPLLLVSTDFTEKEDIEHLLQKLKDSDPFVRVEAVQAFGEIPDEQSLILVSKSLLDDNLYVRAYAAEALGKLGMIDVSLALSKLLAALHDASPFVRAKVIAALGELKDEGAIAPLREMQQDKDETVNKMAAWALGNIENTRSTSIISFAADFDCLGRY